MICVKIDELLKKQKKTKYWLIKNMDSDYQTMNKIINNRTQSIHFNTLNKLCKILNCEVGEIISFKNEEKN